MTSVSKAQESLSTAGQRVIGLLLAEDHIDAGEEKQEAALARNILTGLKRLQASLPNASPEQQHALTTIRAAAHSLVRLHGN